MNGEPRGGGVFDHPVLADLRRKLLDALLPPKIKPEVGGELILQTATDLSHMMLAMAVVGIFTMLLLLVDFGRDAGIDGCGALAGVAAAYVIVTTEALRWLRIDNQSLGAAGELIRRMRVRILLLGAFWALTFVLLMTHADFGQRDLIYGIAVGCLATPVMVSPVSCAFAFWLPESIGAFLAVMIGRQNDLYAMTCLIGFIGLTCYCILFLNKRMMERAISAVMVKEHGEVIKLLLRDFEENASDWLWETDAEMRLRHVSKRLAQVLHKAEDEIVGKFPDILFEEVAQIDQRAGTPFAKLRQFIEQRSPFRDLMLQLRVDGEERYWTLTGKPILDRAGNFAGYHGVGSDITAQRRSQEQIAFLARHDSLTRLPNRVLFNEVLQQACARSRREGIALLGLDLDDFKLVNDTLGHAIGDAVLVAVGERIRSCIRGRDIAARLGGDEFAIILMTADVAEIAVIAERIIESVSRPYHLDGRLVHIGISIGVAIAPQHNDSPSGMMKSADLALYRAKAEGRGVWRLYDPKMDERQQDRRALQQDLRQAIMRKELFLQFQPIVALASQRTVSAEVLLRWNHPERGLLQPTEFIGIAEETGLIASIGAWVLAQACQVAAGWPDDIRIAVNLSPLQFKDSALLSEIDRALTDSNLDPSRLELEITETTMLETNAGTVDALWTLHNRGLRIALDDFGTGYSSLSYLRRFPFDMIKIDRSFIADLGYEKDDSSIILAIIGLANSLNMTVTAEGVETDGQLNLLQSYGCAQGQGYRFHSPMSADEITQLIRDEAAEPAFGAE